MQINLKESMNRNDRTRVIRVRNDRQATIVQPQVSRRYTRPSELIYYRMSDRANLNCNVAEQRRRSPERLMRRNNIPYNVNEMYRHNRSRRYERYTEDSDSETDYSSEYSSGESDSEINVYPRETRLVKVNPTTRGSSSYSDRRITNTNRLSTVHNSNRNVANEQRVVLVRKQPEINRVKYTNSQYNSRFYSDTESETDSSSDADSIYYRDNVRLARAAPTITGNNRRVIQYNENEDQKREKRPIVVRKVTNDENVAPRRVIRYDNTVQRREIEYDNDVGRNRQVRPVVVRRVRNDEHVVPRRVMRYENTVHRHEMEYDNDVGRIRQVRPVVDRKVNNDEHVPRHVMRYENTMPKRETEYDSRVVRNREVRPVVVSKVNKDEHVAPRRVMRYENNIPRRETEYDNDVAGRTLHYNGESPSIRKNEIRNVVRPEVNDNNTVPLRNVKYTERSMRVISSKSPRVVDDVIPVHDRAVLVRNNPSGRNSPTKTTRTAHAVRQETLPPIGYVRRHNSNVDRMMHSRSRDRHSITSSSSSSESYDTDDSSSDSTSSDMIGGQKNKSIESNQTGLLLLDYKKMLQSREERKKYEIERKNHEHETHVVTLVQKEINKPRHNVNKCEQKNDKSGSVHKKQSKCQTTEKAPKPLPKNEKGNMCLEDAEEIKRNIRIEEQRRRKREERGRLEAWMEGENTMDDDDVLGKDDIKQPTVDDLDQSRNPTPGMDNKSEGEDKVEVHVKYDEKFEDMYPEPRQKGCQLVYYIDLTKPPEILEPKPFDVETRRIVPQPKVNTINSFVY